ncbi:MULTISPECIES: DegT/DnrJ/EryC1/StrS aminotransferase family protein [unclassified Treponema]|uniref:DegT/DnrJ/EryC1/StrS family aminotransferase n=1 Tax=unclassified Treponema TaxID=2638727 RepID=UPI0020A2ACED|nr:MULTISPECIES: DegT/DnrJ/EryC1/StrS aminotransferase family protein [unclassified Treponema]UTC67205.1 DegT/DnrJ/EryC1/StrS aminotransferase family protein [Treponema sp. OMZ 789]UTC69934.1 DegT/DnrJ/EryC1/StrS aminotransferase family protein [Treponema sp. OMZ 790]UTC72649.1 DegT/DnrJ/EryC1/StrS aminotransferase family protein [Treponema sp. OMZ 791]
MKDAPAKKIIPFFTPSFSEAEEKALMRVMHSGWLTTGKETLDFEKEFAAFTGSKYALAVNSASSGLMLAMDACGIKKGSKILTSPYTFISTATSALHLGGDVVYADIEKKSYNIDPEKIEDILKKDKSVKAIVPIHIAGNVCNMRAINELANKYSVAVIEDAAHAFPSKTEAGYAGTLGTCGVFSFYATKTITTGEGGIICTNDEKIAERIKLMRSHGINRTIWDRYTDTKASWKYDVTAEGWKCNLPDILSAIGRVQLKKAQSFFEQRKKITEKYNAAFAGNDSFILPPDGQGNAWHLYILRLNLESLKIGRDEFVSALQENGLGISMHFIPHFEMTYIKERYGLNSSDFPESNKKYLQSLSLPLYPSMSEDDSDYVIETVIKLAKLNRR